MTPMLLRDLLSDEFLLSIGFLFPPTALRRRLQVNPLVIRISIAVRDGVITDEMVRAFAEEMTRALQPGVLLPGELPLAALAVALEPCPQEFAEEYLCDLARLKLCEMGTAIRVARECLKARHERPKNEVRKFVYPGPVGRVCGGPRAGYIRTKAKRFSPPSVARFPKAVLRA